MELAASDFGGGNLLRAALAVNPHPDQPFLRSGRPVVTTARESQTDFSLLDLDELAQSWSVWYLEQGVRPRDRVAVYIADSYAYSVHFFALSQIGAIPVMVNSRAPREVALGLVRQTTPVAVFSDEERLARLGDASELPARRWTAEQVPAPPSRRLPDDARYRHVADDPVLILHSSGTTGQPKPVIQTHAGCVAGPRYRLVNFTESPDSLMMSAQPQSHTGFIGYGMYAVLAGTPIVALYDVDGPQLADAIIEHRPTMVIGFSHVFTELAALDLPAGALDSVVGWITMGDAVHEAHMRLILGRRSESLPPAVFYDRFGSTELGWGLMVQQRTLSSERNDRCVGKPDPLAEFAVLRKDGTEAGVDEVGLFGVKAPSLTAGYWNDSDTTYRSKLAGYWLTGDVGYRNADGCYFQLDRAVDVVDAPSGPGYSVQMEELLLSEVAEMCDCAVVAGHDGEQAFPVAVVTTADPADADPEKLFRLANEVLRAGGHPELALLEVARTEEEFPLGVTGKVLKRALREKYAALPAYLRESAGKLVASSSSS
jgi:acyl-coenzyme A synthetase/AMP-(fatty) acid ligase